MGDDLRRAYRDESHVRSVRDEFVRDLRESDREHGLKRTDREREDLANRLLRENDRKERGER